MISYEEKLLFEINRLIEVQTTLCEETNRIRCILESMEFSNK